MQHALLLNSSPALFLLALGLLVSACNGTGGPLAPTPSSAIPTVASSIPPRYVEGDRWNLKATYQGHTGPEACLPAFDGLARTPTDYVLMVQRYGTTIHFVTEHNHYIGRVEGEQFIASEHDDSGTTWQCGTARLRFRTEAQVAGRLSADGQSLIGEEVAVFLLESGETIRRQWGWAAARQ